MRRAPDVAAALIALVAAAAPQSEPPPRGWTLLFDSSGRCSFAVPPAWKVDTAAEAVSSMVTSADGRIVVTLMWSGDALRQAAGLRALPQPKVVREDSARRVWIEMAPVPPLGVMHFAIAPSDRGGCTMEALVGDGARDQDRKLVPLIVGTLSGVQ